MIWWSGVKRRQIHQVRILATGSVIVIQYNLLQGRVVGTGTPTYLHMEFGEGVAGHN